MKPFISALLLLLLITGAISAGYAGSLADCAGVVRVFGDQSSWMSDCFVVGDGSWAITTSDAITETVGPDAEHIIRNPIFVSAYTGKAYQCEVKTNDKELNLALLKLPIKGLPGAPFALASEFSKAGFGTFGQLTSGDEIGNRWPTEVYAVTRDRTSDGTYKLAVAQWNADKVFVTDIGKHKLMFISEVTPEKSIPNGSIIARGASVVGMYINKLTITGGKENIVFGRCSISTEIVHYLGEHGVDTTSLNNPPPPTITRDENADAAFQLQMKIYSLLGAGVPGLAVDCAANLAKLQPQEAQAQMLSGIALVGTGKFTDAIKAFDDAAKLDPKLPALKTNRAIALIGLNKKAEAETELLKAAEEAPSDARPVITLVDFYLADSQTYDKALSFAQKALSMLPDSPSTLLLLAKVEKRMKNYQDSINHIGEALKMAPNWPDAMYALGSTFEEAGDKANAEKSYRKLVEKEPRNPTSLLTLASFLADQGKKDELKELIEKIRALNPPKEIIASTKALENKIEDKQETESKPLPAK